jgi:hypothetical protein
MRRIRIAIRRRGVVMTPSYLVIMIVAIGEIGVAVIEMQKACGA